MTTPDKPLDWINSISQECKETSEFVQEVLDKYGVQQTPNIGKPKRLIIKNLQFSGQKAGKYTNSFQFEFTKLEPGLWGLFSDGNLKGKTSTIEIIRWLLRGESSSNFQGGVKKWIEKARLDFSLDDQVYQVDVNQAQEGIYGTLKEKRKNDLELEISKFSSESGFQTCMSDFMRKQFSLDIISAWRENNGQNETGKSVIHDWSALSGILFIGGDYGCLFGDVNYDGLANRLMNMYLGLPWIPTDSALKVLDKKLGKNKEILENNHQSEQKQRQDRRGFIEQQLETYRSELDEIPLNIDIRDHLNQENEVYLQAQQKTRELNNKLNMIMQDGHQIEMSLIQVKRDYQYFQEAKAVNLIFNGLEPTCCPHCQTSISDERRLQEIQTHSCSLCGEAMISDSEIDDCRENELKEQLTKLSEELKEYGQLIASLKDEILNSENKVTQSKLRCEQLEAKINDFNQRYELERKIAGLEFLLNEYREYSGFSEESESQKPSNKLEVLNREIKVIKKAIVETERRIKFRQKDLLVEVSKKIQEYAIRFGMTSLEEVELKSNPQLKLKKDGVSTTYSRCTDGEKLRLKIASVIALISIAENQGIGRHPGLLLIDSPKREEITDTDVTQIVDGLKTLTKELPYLQVFLAATASEGILGYFDEDHRKYAKGDDFLW